MTKEGFGKLIENAQNYSKVLDRLSDFGIDLFELPISELGWGFLNAVLPELFSDEGVDWLIGGCLRSLDYSKIVFLMKLMMKTEI